MASSINYIFQYTSNILKPAIETINQNIKSNLHSNNISGSFCNLLNVSINSDKILINTTNITTSDINISSLSNLNNLSEPIITSFNNSSNMINNSSNFIIDSINNINTSLNTKYITIDSNSSNYNSNIDNDIIKRLNNLNISNIQNGVINKYIENNVIDYNLIINGNVNILNGIISSNTVTSSSKTIANEDLEIISSSSINPALKIQQNNSQNIIEIYGNTNTKFIVNNGGKFGLGKDPTTSNSLELLGNLNSTTGLYSNSLPFSYFGLSNIPLTFTPSAHLHTISDINGLTSALNTKQNIITSLTSNYNTLNINSGLNILSGYNFKENDNILKLESLVVTSNYWNEKSITIIDNNILKELTNITGTNDFYYAFTSTTGKNSITFVSDTICDVLIVGGGGAGGRYIGGGGGAGGVVYIINKNFQANITYTIKVGSGGTSYDTVGKGLNGEDSYIKLPNDNYDTFDGFNLIGYGGGGGGSYNSADSNAVGKNGGSGGGGGELYSSGNLTIAGQSTQGLTYYNKFTNAYVKGGNNGIIAPSNGAWAGSGGGGCSLTENLTNAGRDGRNGILNDITGVNTYYAAGGGAGINQPASGAPGLGGLGGGGNGSKDGTNTSKNAINGTGSGGGGDYEYFDGNPANAIGGKGGSGIVIIRVRATQIIIGSGGGGGIQSNGTNSIGGSPLINNITGTNIAYASGGNGFSTDSILSSQQQIGLYGNGGNSSINTFGRGGNGVVIIRWLLSPINMGNNWMKIYEHSPPIAAPTEVKNYSISNTAPYRYYVMVVNNNWINNYGCSISKLKLFGYQQSLTERRVIIPPAIYASPKNFNSDAYLFTFDSNNKISEYDTNTINFSLTKFKKDNKYITDKLLNTNNDTPVYGKISRIISEYINRNNNGINELNLSQIDAKIVEYNNDNANIGNQISNSLTNYKNAIFQDIDISGMSFDKYENYDTLSNGKFYLSNDDNIYIKL